MTTKISVLICTRDRPDTVGQAIESVASCDYPSFDLHVMDQSTTSATNEVVERIIDRGGQRCQISYHHLQTPGLSRAYNAGMAVTEAPIIACTDDDVTARSDWLASISAAFDVDPELGLLYGQVCIPENLQSAAAASEIVVPSLTWNARERLSMRERNFKVWGMGANMAVRRTAFDTVGGFDEAMGGGGPLRSSQDFDFSLRVYRAGYAVLLDPDVRVDHYGTRTWEQWPATMRNYGIGDGAFYSKHIRCGDATALRLLLKRLDIEGYRAARATVRERRPVGNTYGRGLLTGMREGLRFDVDRQHRLYRAKSDIQMAATEANAVTGALRDR